MYGVTTKRGVKSFQKQKDGDDHKVLPIMQHLTNLGYRCFREPVITHPKFSTSNKIRRPDIKIELKYKKDWKDDPVTFEIYLEVDGEGVHGIFENQTERTINRNIDYENTNKAYIQLSEKDAKFHNINIRHLAAYRVGEVYSNLVAKYLGGHLIV